MKTGAWLQLRIVAYALIVVGVALGILGSVRSGAITLVVGATTFIFLNYFHSRPRRRIELILPIGICFVLFGVALTLPHAK